MLRGGGGRRRQRGRRRSPAGRRAADAGRAAARSSATASTWRSCCRPRTTPTRTTASSSSRATATSSRRRRAPSSADRAGSDGVDRRGAAERTSAIGRVRELRGTPRGLPARAAHAFRRPATSSGSTCCSTAPTAPPTTWRLRSSAASGRRHRDRGRRPTGATSTTACGSTHVEALGRARAWQAGTRSASPSTATATACSRSIARATSSTATS